MRKYLSKIDRNVSEIAAEQAVFALRTVEDDSLGSKVGFERIICHTIGLESRLMALADSLSNVDASEYAKEHFFRWLGPMNAYFKQILGDRCDEVLTLQVTEVERNKLKYKTGLVPMMALLGGEVHDDQTSSSKPEATRPASKRARQDRKKNRDRNKKKF